MAERIHIQHFHSTTAETPQASSLYIGEIAVVAKAGKEKLFIINSNSALTSFISEDATNTLLDGKSDKGHKHVATDITGGTFDAARIPTGITVSKANLATTAEKVQSAVTFQAGEYSGDITYSGNTAPTINIPTKTSHLKNDSNFITGYTEVYKGTVTSVTAGSGLTGGGNASTGATGVTLNVGAGTGISVSDDAVSISTEYQNKIASGASAYTMVNAFLANAEVTGSAIDTLVEIQEYIKNDGQAAADMLDAIDSAQTTANSALSIANNYKGTLTGVTAGEGLTGGASASTGSTGVTIEHATASTSTTNTATTLSNGGSFVVSSIESDKFGHVTGKTNTTYTLPTFVNTDSATTESGHYKPSTSASTVSGSGDYVTGIQVDSKNHVIGVTTGNLPSVGNGTITIKQNGVSKGTFTVNQNSATTIELTDNDTKELTISANASDDDIVVLSGTAGTNAVTYSASHAKKGPSNGYTSSNTTTSITGSGASATIKIPQITVDSYGHVTAASDESVTITMPTIPTSLPANGGNADTVDNMHASAFALSSHTHDNYVNQNAFSVIKVGTTTVSADTTTDELVLSGGTSIDISANASNDTITFNLTSISCGTF